MGGVDAADASTAGAKQYVVVDTAEPVAPLFASTTGGPGSANTQLSPEQAEALEGAALVVLVQLAGTRRTSGRSLTATINPKP